MAAHRLLWILSVLAGALGACGTSTVSLVVVRPAMINARPHGNSVSIGGFHANRPDLAGVAAALRQDLARRVVESVGGVVRLVDSGGGLLVSGTLVAHDVTFLESSRPASCGTQTVTTVTNGVAATVQQPRACTRRELRWTARVVVHLRVASAQGQVLYMRPHVAEKTDVIVEEAVVLSPWPDLYHVLGPLRERVADEMAAVIAPHRERVSATFYDCEAPATEACAAGVRLFAQSQYDPAAAAFTDAIDKLAQGPATLTAEDKSKPWWDRALVYQYSRRFDMAIADFRKSCDLEPRSACQGQMADVERERRIHAQLVDEGLGQ